jgi:hypothetical protein
MGGAFGALGGDLSAIHVNPGGVGVFRASEFNITPYLDFDKTKAVDKESTSAFRIGNMGIVLNFPFRSGIRRGINFAFNYVNMNNFNRNILQYGGVNAESSLIDVWGAQANGYTTDKLRDEAWLAYETALIDLRENSNDEYKSQLYRGDRVEQERYITERGYQGEYVFSVGVNFSDKFYVGGSLGSQIIKYTYHSQYWEGVRSDTSILDEFTHDVVFETTGSGVNLKVGAIYRPVSFLRLGLAIHTPTYYKLSAYNENGIESFFNTPPLKDQPWTQLDKSVTSEYDYHLQTPWRFISSIALVLNKRFILSADYELVDYPSADLQDTYHGEYDWIREFLEANTRRAHNFRVGTEFRVNSLLSLRGGYAYQGAPYARGDWNEKNHLQSLSTGAGFNFGNFYTDVAYLYKTATDTDYFYSHHTDDGKLFSSKKIETTLRNQEFRCSFGVKF